MKQHLFTKLLILKRNDLDAKYWVFSIKILFLSAIIFAGGNFFTRLVLLSIDDDYLQDSVLLILGMLFILCTLLFFSKMGQIKIIAIIFAILVLASSVITYKLESDITEPLLIYALVIILFRIFQKFKYASLVLNKERVLLETKLKTISKELMQTKLKQQSDFLDTIFDTYGLMHDLVNPLNLVSLNLDRLWTEKIYLDREMSSQTKETLQRAMIGTKKLQDFIETSRRQINQYHKSRYFDVRKEIDQAIQVIDPKIRYHQIRIKFSGNKNLKLYGNPAKFNRVIINLLSNAVDAYNDFKSDNRLIIISLQKVSNFTQIIVTDYGKGISPANSLKVFKKMFSTKDYLNGSGLGLMICHNIIKNDFLGTIRFKSNLGKGSQFIINLPTNVLTRS